MLPKIFSRRALFTLASGVLLFSFAFGIFPSGSVLADSSELTAFRDVTSTHTNYAAINYIHAQKIVEGYSDGTFRPDQLINRAEFTKIISEAFHKNQTGGASCFSDVGTEWFAKYICADQIRSFISGYPDGRFQPANNINFVEAAKILTSVKGFTMTPDATIWYRPFVEQLVSVHAVPLSIKSFNQRVTRGETAEMIYRLKTNRTDQPSKTYQDLLQTSTSYTNSELPVRLIIPSINVDSAVEYVGLTLDGAVDVPKDPASVAWFDLGPRPGDAGSAVLTGHINWRRGMIGVFADLHKVKPGDKVSVQDIKGKLISFVVREIRIYDAREEAPDVFNLNDGKSHLNLITCDGSWNYFTQSYSQRLVVFADRE